MKVKGEVGSLSDEHRIQIKTSENQRCGSKRLRAPERSCMSIPCKFLVYRSTRSSDISTTDHFLKPHFLSFFFFFLLN